MAESIIYLNVPFAQKDAAKALGARWDAANKKWYIPSGKNVALFAQWQPDATRQTATSQAKIDKPSSAKTISAAGQSSGVFTYPSSTDFEPYSGNEPPWN
jgi:hypothetical protein